MGGRHNAGNCKQSVKDRLREERHKSRSAALEDLKTARAKVAQTLARIREAKKTEAKKAKRRVLRLADRLSAADVQRALQTKVLCTSDSSSTKKVTPKGKSKPSPQACTGSCVVQAKAKQ